MDDTRLPDARLDAVVRVADDDRLHTLLERPLDFGCRAKVVRNDDGSASVVVIATAAEMAELRTAGFELTERAQPAQGSYEVGTGDRFDGGRVTPQGLGRKLGDRPTPSQPR